MNAGAELDEIAAAAAEPPPWFEDSAGPIARGAWLDVSPLLGFSGSSKLVDLEQRARHADPGRFAAALREGFTAHPGAECFALLDPTFSAAWSSLQPSGEELPPLHLVLPNVRGIIREATEHGMIGAGIRRLLRMGPLGMVGLGVRNIPEGPGVLRRHFPTMLRLLTRVELAEARRLRPATILLQQQMTDLAAAHGHARLLADFVRIVRRAGFGAGWITANPARLCGLARSGDAMGSIAADDSPTTIVSLRSNAEKCDWPSWVRLIGPDTSSGDARFVRWPIAAAATHAPTA